MKTVFLLGADDAAGRRVAVDLCLRGMRVFVGVSCVATSSQPAQTPQLALLEVNPRSDASLARAAALIADAAGGIDMLVLNCVGAAPTGTILDGLDYAAIADAYDAQTLSPLRAVHHFLPLLRAGAGKRICYVTTCEGCNNLCDDTRDYGAHLSRAALNMQARILFNRLRPEGFTFRLYCRDSDAPDHLQGAYAAEYFLRDRCYYPEEDYIHNDENRLVLRDGHARELPW
ncbi:MAG: SDR family NAD(P)-dependent oxidoreductase [Eubacteriales bacterium]|nr:SDR family NAD(P)-dependent oxidoreductase [Eubacteriales bacterium]